jgi:hypothetical protein
VFPVRYRQTYRVQFQIKDRMMDNNNRNNNNKIKIVMVS